MIQAVRSIVSVMIGYVLFAAPSFAFFVISGQSPHQEAPAAIMLASVLVGVGAAFVGGFVAAVLAGRHPLGHGIAVAIVLACGATASLVSTIGHGAIWSQVAAIAVMAPSAAAGGWLRARRIGPR